MSMLIDIYMRLLLLLFFVSLFASVVNGASVIRVIDGDTLVIDDYSKIRLYGIDCPERGQAGEAEAAQATFQLLDGQTIRLKKLYADRYGRAVAIVILESGNTLQEALLQKGMAWVAPRFCKRPECDYWRDLEMSARLARIGIWQDEYAVPPWEWRKRNRNSRGSQ